MHSTNNPDDGYLGSGKALLLAFKKYGKENFTRRKLCFCDSVEEAHKKEAYYIKKYNTVSPNGYNISPKGGLGCPGSFSDEIRQTMRENHADFKGENHPRFGSTHTDKSKQKNRDAKNAFYQTEEGIALRQKISESKKGGKQSEESNEKRRKAQIGILRSPEVCKKISEGNKGKKNSPEAIEKNRQAQLLRMADPKERQKLKDAAIKQWEKPGYKEEHGGFFKGKHHSDKTKEQMRASQRKRYSQ